MTYNNFYTQQYNHTEYASVTEKEAHSAYKWISDWLSADADRKKRKFLEIGSGRGALQDIVEDYTGIDFAGSVEKYYHKPFYQARAEELPFEDHTFDVVFSYAVWEHISDPQKAFEEVIRVAKNGGVFLLLPAWHCKPWFAQGYHIRPYSDFRLPGKLYKASIPLRNSQPVRATDTIVRRTVSYLKYIFQGKNYNLSYRKLDANYDFFWCSDSDACNDLDSFPVVLWFKSRGCECHTYPSLKKAFTARTGALEFMIKKW